MEQFTTEQAASSPAIEQQIDVELTIPTDREARREWMKTGNLPKETKETKEATTDQAESSTAKESSSAKADEAAAAPETANTQEQKQKPKSAAALRLEEVLADLKRAGLTPEELKTFKREAAKAAETKAEPSPAAPVRQEATRPKPTQEDKAADGKPKYASYEDFVEDLADWKAEQRHAQFVREQQETAQRQVMSRQFEDAKKAYPDFEAKAKPVMETLNTDKSIPEYFKAAIATSPVFAHLLYALSAEQAQTLLATSRTNGVEAIKQLGVLENAVMTELEKGKAGDGKTAERGEDGKFQKAPEKKQVTEAPPIGREVNAKATPPADEVEHALERDDFRAAMNAENRRALQKRKG